MKFLIAGLGNPGKEYENTRHNAGFRIVEALADEAGVSFLPNRFGDVAEFRLKNKRVTLLKPNTFMNLSGNAVRFWLTELKVEPTNLLVILDDLALPFGKLRLRLKGSDGGHNGLKSIQEELQTSAYPRLRFGVGNDFPKGRQSDYVLGNWNAEEKKLLEEKIKAATEAAKKFILSGEMPPAPAV